MDDGYADELGLSLGRDDLSELSPRERRELAEVMPKYSSLYSDHSVFSDWLDGSGDDYFEDEHMSVAENALLDIYHPDTSSEGLEKALHTYIQDTGDLWRLAEDQGQYKLTLFDPLNTKCLQTPRADNVEDRFLAQAVVNHNSDAMREEFSNNNIRTPKILGVGAAEIADTTIPYDVARYESCIPFERVKEEFSEEKAEDIEDRAYEASERMSELIEDGEVLFVSENEFWKHGKPENGAYHPETDNWVLWDRGEYAETINSISKEDFVEEHRIDQEAKRMMEELGVKT